MSMWLAYFTAVSMLIIVPGPMAANQVRLGTFNTPQNCVFSALGGTTVSNIYVALVFLFISTISQYQHVLTIVQYFGAAYLFFLSYKTLKHSENTFNTQLTPSPLSKWQLYLSGASVALSNVKDIMFFVAFLPLFIVNYSFSEYIAVAITWIFMDVSSMLVYSTFANKMTKVNKKMASILSFLSALSLYCVGIMIILRNAT